MKKLFWALLMMAVFVAVAVVPSVCAVEYVPQGGLTLEERSKTRSEIVQEVLADPTIPIEARNNFLRAESMRKALKNNRNQNTLADVNLETYLVYVTAIMQEDNSKCAPASIQMVLDYINGSYNTQTYIQNRVGKGPGLQKVLDYLNSQQSRYHYTYTYFYNEDDLIDSCKVAKAVGAPIVFSVKPFASDYAQGIWPYNSNGHFTVLHGLYSESKYSFADPFYFTKYMGYAANGSHV